MAYTLDFDGYYPVPRFDRLPEQSSIYCVYTQRHGILPRRLLYIGESQNVRVQVSRDTRIWQTWLQALREDEEMVSFSAALISPDGARERAAAAMIYHHQPPCNVEYTDHFPFDRTTVTITGKMAKLSGHFTVNRT